MIERTLLCIDDDSTTLRSLQRLLRGEGYRVLTAGSASEALALLVTEPVQIALVNQRMPDVNGNDLLQQIKEKYPSIIRLVLSGYAEVSAILESINEGEVYRFLSKPWDSNELKGTLRQSFEHYELQQLNEALFHRNQFQNDTLVRLNSELEAVVENRTYLLRLIQEVVQHIPLPFVALDLSGQIVTANSGFLNQLENKTVLWSDINDVFPVDVANQIHGLLQEPVQKEASKEIDGGALGRLQVVLFSFDAEVRGAIVILVSEGL